MLTKRPANVGEFAHVRILRLEIRGMGYSSNVDDAAKNCCTHLARHVRDEAYDNRYVPKNSEITVEEENE